jgi:hypothetical protein
MEPSGRNRRQPVANARARKRRKQADPQPVATQGNGSGAHGKEGVDGNDRIFGRPRHPGGNLRHQPGTAMEFDARLKTKRPATQAFWNKRYWARTSDPQLVDTK